jgi:hypothetical protein
MRVKKMNKVAMCEVRSREKRPRTPKKKYSGQQQKEMD